MMILYYEVFRVANREVDRRETGSICFIGDLSVSIRVIAREEFAS